MPALFQNNWAPQAMPTTNMALQNNFANFNLNNLGSNMNMAPQYPPQQNFNQPPPP